MSFKLLYFFQLPPECRRQETGRGNWKELKAVDGNGRGLWSICAPPRSPKGGPTRPISLKCPLGCTCAWAYSRGATDVHSHVARFRATVGERFRANSKGKFRLECAVGRAGSSDARSCTGMAVSLALPFLSLPSCPAGPGHPGEC